MTALTIVDVYKRQGGDQTDESGRKEAVLPGDFKSGVRTDKKRNSGTGGFCVRNCLLYTSQQYEQRRKDINKAQTETLLKIARALVYTVEDLVEKVPP